MQFLSKFLSAYRIPSDVKLSEIPWEDFFKEVVQRFKSAEKHMFLSNFLQNVGMEYQKSNRPVDFITDLLELETSKLLSGESSRHKNQCIDLDVISRSCLCHFV